MIWAETASKLSLVAWAVVVILAQSFFASPGWPALRWLLPFVLLATSLLAWKDRRVVALVVGSAYLFPVSVFWRVGAYTAQYSAIWLAAMLGVLMPDALRRPGWRLASTLRLPLVAWAAAVAFAVPIIVLRESDMRWELLFRARLTSEALGGLTFQSTSWILHAGLTIVIGILWFDWLCGGDQGFLERYVMVPLAAGFVALAGVCVYQMVVDVHFLNPTIFAVIGRASGTLLDANPAGVLAALWSGGVLLLVVRPESTRWHRVVALVLWLLSWGAVWATGSRTALASAVVILGFAGASLTRAFGLRRVMPAAVFAAVVLVGVVSVSSTQVSGPIRRLNASIPSRSLSGLEALSRSLWERDGYGVAAHRMIARHPLVGVGLGTYERALSEFSDSLPSDNAQNWFRHQLAEFGILGSVGWLWFVLSFGLWILKRRSGGKHEAIILIGMLVAFALVSLVGMPGQDSSVAFTLCALMAWYLAIVGQPVRHAPPSWSPLFSAVVFLVFVGGTGYLAAGELRVPVRVQRERAGEGVAYSYGFWAPEHDADGEFRWTRRRATAVVPVSGRVMRLNASVYHSSESQYPVHFKAWVNQRLVVDADLTGAQPSSTTEILLPQGQRRVLVETLTSPVVRAPEPDSRELGVMVRWGFSPTSSPPQ